MIEDDEIEGMAVGLAQAYGLARASATATNHALAALDDGYIGVATTWRRILNVLNRRSNSVASMIAERESEVR